MLNLNLNINNRSNSGGGGASFDAISGETAFSMTDIAGENIPDLYISYDVPAGSNLKLFAYLHGWGGGGGIVGALDPAAITWLKGLGFAVIGVGLRGRNTGVDYANDGVDVEEYRDAGGLEGYDLFASIKYFLENIITEGHVSKSKIVPWDISGAGLASYAAAQQFPGFASVMVQFYCISKAGTYVTDPRPSLTSWYTNQLGFQSDIQKAVGGAPFGSTGYTAGNIDEYYLNRDMIDGIGNAVGLTKFHVYHDTNDTTVYEVLSEAITDKMDADGVDYVYYKTTDETYQHGEADLLVDKFSLSPQHGLDWIDDAQTLTRSVIGNSGTMRVKGLLAPVDLDLNFIFEVWVKRYRKNASASPRSAAYGNQGKYAAANLVYNISNNTYEVSLIKGNTSVGDQIAFVDVRVGSNYVMALLHRDDTVVLKPNAFAMVPYSMGSYNWNIWLDFSDEDYYILDETGDVSNVLDLTGNNNFAFQPTRASRQPVSGGGVNAPIFQFNGTTPPLNTQVNLIEYATELTFVIVLDLGESVVTSVAENVFGRGGGSASLFRIDNTAGKIQVNFGTQTGAFIANSTPVNTDLGKQVWVVRRNSSNAVFVSCKNASGTYEYSLGTAAGTFDLRVIGNSASLAQQFNGIIYKFCATPNYVSDADKNTILSAEI